MKNFFLKNRKGDILIENVIFIILNIIFISLLLIFLWNQGSGAVLLEQTHAKQISLLIDSSEPVMKIKLNMDKAFELAKENGLDFDEVVTITGNVVNVKLSEKGGYEYAFFNDVRVGPYPEEIKGEYTGVYVFTINPIKENE